MKKIKATLLVSLVAVIAGSTAVVCRADSSAAKVLATTESWMWHTLFTNTVPLTWNWPNGATTARLVISGMNSATQTVVVTAPESNYTWTAFAAAKPAQEEVYQVALTFFEQSAVSEAYTTQLAVVSGAFGPTPVKTDPASRAWSLIRADTVIPYAAEWSDATAAGTAAQLSIVGPRKSVAPVLGNAFGCYGLKLLNSGWGFGTFNLTLSFAGIGATQSATLYRPADAFILRLE